MATRTQEQIMTPVITVKHEDGGTTEVFVLNPGEIFVEFGGSRHNLRVNKTASIILRRQGPWGLTDTEYDVYNAGVWEWINEHMQKGLKVAA